MVTAYGLVHFTLNNPKQEKHSLKRVSLVLSSGRSRIRRKGGLETDYLLFFSCCSFFSFIIFFLHLLSLSSPLLSILPPSPFLPSFLPPHSSSTIFSLPPPMCKQAQKAWSPLAPPSGSATGFKGSQFFPPKHNCIRKHGKHSKVDQGKFLDHLMQCHYVEKVLSHFSYKDYKPSSAPYDSSLILRKNKGLGRN